MKNDHPELSGSQLLRPSASVASGLGWYNGYSPAERNDKFRAMKRKIASGELPPPSGPCTLCGDPDSEVEYHDEDYGIPYRWSEPSAYVLCRHCHRQKLHLRFARPVVWQAFLAHVRRGGYARDLEAPHIKREFVACCKAIEQGQAFVLHQLRPYRQSSKEEWFSHLSLNRMSLRDLTARTRPSDGTDCRTFAREPEQSMG